jgi:membrane fusion protein, multidrug efflux system
VHPGALVGPESNSALVNIQQISRLRLVVPVPEQYLGGMKRGAAVKFTVPAAPNRTFTGTISRPAHALDQKTRTMAVELDVVNPNAILSPGMYPTVHWPVASQTNLLVPKTSVVTTTERTFVIRNDHGRAEWVDVRKGIADGDLLAVTGALRTGDKIVLRATDELRDGSALSARQN